MGERSIYYFDLGNVVIFTKYIGYRVLIPDYFRGRSHDPQTPGVPDFIKETSQWENLKKDWLESIKPYALKHGAKKFASLGNKFVQ